MGKPLQFKSLESYQRGKNPDLDEYEEYNSFELDAMAKTNRENVLEVLSTRFEVLPPDLSSRLNQIEDLTLLKQLLKRAVTVASVDEFEQILANSSFL